MYQVFIHADRSGTPRHCYGASVRRYKHMRTDHYGSCATRPDRIHSPTRVHERAESAALAMARACRRGRRGWNGRSVRPGRCYAAPWRRQHEVARLGESCRHGRRLSVGDAVCQRAVAAAPTRKRCRHRWKQRARRFPACRATPRADDSTNRRSSSLSRKMSASETRPAAAAVGLRCLHATAAVKKSRLGGWCMRPPAACTHAAQRAWPSHPQHTLPCFCSWGQTDSVL